MPSTSEPEQKHVLRRIINGAHTAFLVTASEHNGLHGRPMANAEVAEAVDVIYFATDRHSGKVEELAADDRVFLGYVQRNEWATVSGRGRIVDDRAKIRDLWTPLWKNWFSGPDDPKIVLIAVTPDRAEYWDQANQIVTMAKMAFTAVTGKKTGLGDHGNLKL